MTDSSHPSELTPKSFCAHPGCLTPISIEHSFCALHAPSDLSTWDHYAEETVSQTAQSDETLVGELANRISTADLDGPEPEEYWLYLARAILPLIRAREAAARAEGRRECAVILKGIGKINGDDWKDTTKIGEVVFVWNDERPPPYAPGQFPRIGNEGWSASRDQYDFQPATVGEVQNILRALTKKPIQPDELAKAKADAERLAAAVKEARDALHFHYVEWDGEPEDATPLQLARSKCDAALATYREKN